MSQFQFSLEGIAYEVTDERTVTDRSHVYDSSLLGRVSLTADETMFSDEEIFTLLRTAHAEDSLAARFAHFHDEHTGWKDAIGRSPSPSRGPPHDVFFEELYLNGRIETEYLQSLCSSHEDGGKVIYSLMKYDTPIDTSADEVVRQLVHETDSFDIDVW